MDKRIIRILSLLSMLGVGMTVPILIAAYLSGRYYSDNKILVILTILFGIGVSFRNTYKIIMHEINLKSDKEESLGGRPPGYEDPEDDK